MLGLAWNTAIDADFVQILEQVCQAKGVPFVQITLDNLRQIFRALLRRELRLSVLIDRASDMDLRFLPLAQWAHDLGVAIINPYKQAAASCDKSRTHQLLICAGLLTPHTIIIPSYHDEPNIAPLDLSWLGTSFVIKPARGRGGAGVVLDAHSWEQVLMVRREYPAEPYFLQVRLVTACFDSRPTWFRVLYCVGAIFPCWWNPATHWYDPLTPDDIVQYGLQSLLEITGTIAEVCELAMFSTEIALTVDQQFVVVDYANDQIDLRLQSNVWDGVPDQIVWTMAECLAEYAMEKGRG